MRTNVLYDVEEALLQVIHHGLCLGLVVVIRYHSIQNGVVTGFLDVCSYGQDHPQRVVREVAADLVVALLSQRLILVIASAVFQLCGSQIDQTLSCSVRNLVYEAQQVLVGVTEAHTTTDTALEVRSGTRHVKGNHALILVPDVDHTVHLVIRSLDAVLGQQCIPHCLQFSQCSSNLFRCVVLFDHLVCTGLVHAAVCVPLLILRVFYVAQNEDQLLGLARSQGDFLIMGGDGRPAVCHGVGSLAGCNDLRILEAVVQTEEALTVGVVAVDGIIYSVECKVVAALLIFGLVENGGAFDLHFAGVEVSLEVGGVVLCVPQTPLNEGEQLDGLCLAALVLQNQTLDLAVIVLRHKEGDLCGDTILLAGDDGVAHAVTAGVSVQIGLDRRPARRPYGLAVLDVEVTAAHVNRYVVVTVTGDSAETGILVEVIAAGSVGDQGEKLLCSEVIDPRIRGFRILNDVFFVCVVKIAKFH